MLKRVNVPGVLTIIGGFIVHLVIGCLYLWGAITIYVTSYFRRLDPTLTVRFFFITIPISEIPSGFGNILGAYLENKYNARLPVAIGCALIVICTFLESYLDNVYAFVILYVVSFGFGKGIAYTPPLVCTWKHLPKYKSVCNGIILGGFGCAAFIFNFVVMEFVNPNDIEPSIQVHHEGEKIDEYYYTAEVYDNVPKMFRYLSIIWLCMSIVGVALIISPKKNRQPSVEEVQLIQRKSKSKLNQQTQEGESPQIIEQASDEPSIDVMIAQDLMKKECPSFKAGLLTFQFWSIFIAVSISCIPGDFTMYTYKEVGNQFHYTDLFLTTVGSCCSIMNGCGRIIWGIIYHKIGFKKTYFIVLIGEIAFTASVYYTGRYVSPAMFLVWIIILIFFFCGHFSTFPSACPEIFGFTYGGRIYSVIFIAYTLSTWGVFILGEFLLTHVGYGYLYVTLAGLTLVTSLILHALTNYNIDWSKYYPQTKIPQQEEDPPKIY